ncbi:MAG: hypothetical protein U0452_11975 [Anaerolineae bacterium]
MRVTTRCSKGTAATASSWTCAPSPKRCTPARLRALWRSFPRRGEADAVFIPAFNQVLGPAIGRSGGLCGVPVLMDYLVSLTM